MDGILVRTLIALGVVGPLFVWSVVRIKKQATAGAALQLVGALALLAVIGAHVCEGLQLFPSWGWGRPHTVGHYFDLTSAIVGVTFVPVGFVLGRWGHS